MEKTKYTYILRAIFGILSVIVAVIIFAFSSQNGEESGETSRGIVRQVIDSLPITKNMDEMKKNKLVEDSQFCVRKLAHFSIYALLGIFLMLFFITFEGNIKTKVIYVVIICILYAISDEIHQSFSDGRTPMIRDVFIDTMGGLTGSLLVAVFRLNFRKDKSNINGNKTQKNKR